MLAGCGGSDSAPDTTPSTGSAASESATADQPSPAERCGQAEATRISDNLNRAGYDVSSNGPTQLTVTLPDAGLPQISTVGVEVFCDQGEAEREARAIQVGTEAGSEIAIEVVGRTLYIAHALPDVDMESGRNKPIPPLNPIVEELVAVGSGDSSESADESAGLPAPPSGRLTPQKVSACLREAGFGGVSVQPIIKGYEAVAARTPEGQQVLIAPTGDPSVAAQFAELLREAPAPLDVRIAENGETLVSIHKGASLSSKAAVEICADDR